MFLSLRRGCAARTPEKRRVLAGSAGAKRFGRSKKKRSPEDDGCFGLEIGLDVALGALDSAGGLAGTAVVELMNWLD